MRVIVTGGGTGGHIYPALAVAEALRAVDPEIEVHYIGGEAGMERTIVPPTGLPSHFVTSRKLRRLASVSTIGVVWSLLKGYGEAARIMRRFDPAVVISTGGYTAAATALAAARQGRPTIIQEYNAVPGRTNLWLSRWAKRICVWFERTKADFPTEKTVVTGVPLRGDVRSEMDREDARKALGLSTEPFTVLVLGGSQGARRVNELVTESVPMLGQGVQVLHQTGEGNIEAVKSLAGQLNIPDTNYRPVPYLSGTDLTAAYRASDLLICRCGIGTLAEAALNELPMLMIPLPTAYADHQTANAQEMERAGAGMHLPEGSLSPEALAGQIGGLQKDPARLKAMSAAAKAASKPDAAKDVAQLAIELAGRKN